jgi:hypothetical protein
VILKAEVTLRHGGYDVTYSTESMVETEDEARAMGVTFAELYAACEAGMAEAEATT